MLLPREAIADMRDKLLFLLTLLALCVPGFAQNTQLSGSLVEPNGTGFTGSFQLSLPVPAAGSSSCTGGPAEVLPNEIVNVQVVNGSMTSAPKVWGADCLTPTCLPYNVKIQDPQGNIILNDQWIIGGTTFDIGQAQSYTLSGCAALNSGSSGFGTPAQQPAVMLTPTTTQTVILPNSTNLNVNLASTATTAGLALGNGVNLSVAGGDVHFTSNNALNVFSLTNGGFNDTMSGVSAVLNASGITLADVTGGTVSLAMTAGAMTINAANVNATVSGAFNITGTLHPSAASGVCSNATALDSSGNLISVGCSTVYRGSWTTGTAYAVNDLVLYATGTYVNILALTSTTSPNADTTHWTLLGGGGITNPFANLGDTMYSDSAGTPQDLPGPTAPNGVPQYYTETPSAGLATPPVWSVRKFLGRVVSSGSTDAVVATDRGETIVYTDATAVATTLPAAATFGSNFGFTIANDGVGVVTITPVSGTITTNQGNAAASLTLAQGKACDIKSFDNTNYYAFCSVLWGDEEVVAFSATPAFSSHFSESTITLTGNVTSFTVGNGTNGQPKTLIFCQDATGSRTVSGVPANVHGFFTIGSTLSKCSAQHFVFSSVASAWVADSAGATNE
jgi:hypothetical protein